MTEPLSDKFVIPAEAVEWLDPDLFPKAGYGKPVDLNRGAADEEMADRDDVEALPDDAQPH